MNIKKNVSAKHFYNSKPGLKTNFVHIISYIHYYGESHNQEIQVTESCTWLQIWCSGPYIQVIILNIWIIIFLLNI